MALRPCAYRDLAWLRLPALAPYRKPAAATIRLLSSASESTEKEASNFAGRCAYGMLSRSSASARLFDAIFLKKPPRLSPILEHNQRGDTMSTVRQDADSFASEARESRAKRPG